MKRNEEVKVLHLTQLMLQEKKIKTKDVFMVMNKAFRNRNSQITNLLTGLIKK